MKKVPNVTICIGFILLTVTLSDSVFSTDDSIAVTMVWESSQSCISWRQTGNCSADGPREPSGDLPCTSEVRCDQGDCPSGYCECGDGEHIHPVDCHPGSHSSFKCADECPKMNNITNAVLVISNGFVKLLVSVQQPAVVGLYADFSGQGVFNKVPILSSWRLEREDDSGSVFNPSPAALSILSNTSDLASISLSGIVDDMKNPSAEETWLISLHRDSRLFSFNTSGTMTKTISAKSIKHSLGFEALSIFALFDRGVVQMKGAKSSNHFFCGTDTLSSVYGLGGGTAFDLRRQVSGSASKQVILLSLSSGSGLENVLAGRYSGSTDVWTKGWEVSKKADIKKGTTWKTSINLSPNNFNFPTFDLTTGSNLPSKDLEALLTGALGTSPGCLCTYDNEVVEGKRVAQIATTIAHPGRSYSGNYNFFDPDNFISLTGLMYAGNSYLQEQARLVIERSGAFLKSNGQLPHHFKKDVPTYSALSGAEQTGPNTFWVKTALQYARVSGNTAWLQQYMPVLRHAATFCFNLIKLYKGYPLLDAPGSLMIDVFIRNHYTSDSNAMMVGFLREFAEAEEFVGNHSGATHLYRLADNMSIAVNKFLWATDGHGLGGDDHFITQLNPNGTTRDFVDYDSNLIAIAHQIPDLNRSKRFLKRLDSGRCSASSGAGPQFVSEKWYGKKDTINGHVGDSWCSMGRIAWFDGHARKRVGDLKTFNNAVLGPIQRDLLKDTWMRERYGCDGLQQKNRSEAYFEYPCTVAMLLREIRYGINIGLSNITVDPFGVSSYSYHVGNVNVDYSSELVKISVPGHGSRVYVIMGMESSKTFKVTVMGNDCGGFSPVTTTVSVTGALIFKAPIGVDCVVSAALVSNPIFFYNILGPKSINKKIINLYNFFFSTIRTP